MEKSELRVLFESEYPGKKAIFEKLIQPIFAKAKDTTLTDNQILSDSDKKQIKSFSIIAQVKGGFPVTFADVEVQDSVALKRSRVNIQNCVRKMMANDSNAIMFFHFTDDKNEWRVSYCHRATTNKESTDAKRFTYLCGTDHACKTIAERFDTLQGLSTIKDEDMLEAFSVAPLSDDFFNEYRERYADLVEYISGKRFVKKGGKFVEEKTSRANAEYRTAFNCDDKLVRDYVKKMMGRLVFLHFLQKKGWLGVPINKEWGNGDKNFIFNLFNNADENIKSDFLKQALEPLFFNTLNIDRGEKAIAEPVCEIYGSKIRIPYLNGGLFEKDDLDEREVRFKKEHFETLLNFFNQYNFTIDETDPDDQEIGVDPEMLGKIFENLLEDNKDKGAFYTPKEIVQYMCRESLIAYLEEKTKLDTRDFVIKHEANFTSAQKADVLKALLEVKVCDPAVGSGAFPMGMMNELLACTEILIGGTKTRAELKKHIVKNNIYGVDIEKGAVDIARLRFWLAIIVDEEEPLPLPNLDYKIMQGNSLLESYEGIDLTCLTKKRVDNNGKKADDGKKGTKYYEVELPSYGDDGKVVDYVGKLIKKLDSYYQPRDHEAKKTIDKQIQELARKILSDKFADKKVLDKLEKEGLKNNSNFFLWHTWFNDVFNRPNDCNGFDIVIGNPPYIKEYTNKAAFDGFRENSPYYVGKMDLWYGFACYGIDLLRQNGVLCFIAQNNWTTSAGAKLMRKKIIEDSKIRQMLDFNTYMIFENADIQTMVMLFERTNKENTYSFDYRTLLAGSVKEDMLALLKKNNTQKTKYMNPKIIRKSIKGKLLTFSENDSIFDKIADNKLFLTEDEATNGIHTHHDCVTNKINKEFPDLPVGQPIFVLPKQFKDSLKLTKKELSLIKPFFTSEEIFRYYTNPNNSNWIIYTNSDYKKKDSLNEFPKLKAHLDSVKKAITSDNKPYGLHRAREEHFFQGEKIISLRKCVDRPCFSYNDFDCYVPAMYYVIQTTRWDMKFLTGILNSKLVAFWLKNKGKMQGENYQVDKEPLLGIPLPKSIPADTEKMIVDLVDKILYEKEKDSTTDISSYEEKIDNIVYELYGLSEEDVNLIK